MKLAEGAIGDVNALPEGVSTSMVQRHPLRVVALDNNGGESSSFGHTSLSTVSGAPFTSLCVCTCVHTCGCGTVGVPMCVRVLQLFVCCALGSCWAVAPAAAAVIQP